MKKIFYLAAAAALVFTFGCSEEQLDTTKPGQGEGTEGPAPAGGFSIIVTASPQTAEDQLATSDPAAALGTKTVFDEGSVSWEQDDQLAVYISGGETAGLYRFTKAEGENTFSTTEFTPADGVEYTYSVIYPYTDAVDAVSATVSIESGDYNQSNADGNIDTPMWGNATATGSATPEISLKHLATVVRVDFDNQTGSPIPVQTVSIIADEASVALSGTFTVNLADGTLTPADAFNSASVAPSAIAPAGQTSSYYLAFAPFSGDFTVNVATEGETYTEEKTKDFAAGLYYNTQVTVRELPETVTSLTLTGTADGSEPISIAQTLENESLFAWKGTLAAGTYEITVNGIADAYLTGPSEALAVDGTEMEYGISWDSYSWTIESEDTYRIIVDAEAGKVRIYNTANDLSARTVTFKRTHGDANDNFTMTPDCLYIIGKNAYFGGEQDSQPVGGEFVLKQSLANPRIFVYKGSTLKTNEAIKFLVDDNWNNEFAYGAGIDGTKDKNTSKTVTLGEKYTPISGDQGNSRYTYFIIPEGTNYIELYIGAEETDNTGNALNQNWVYDGSYALFDHR